MPTQWKSTEKPPMISDLNEDTRKYLMERLREEWYRNLQNLDYGRDAKARIIEKTMDNLMNINCGLPPFHYQTDPDVLEAYLLNLQEKSASPLVAIAILDTFAKESFKSLYYLRNYQEVSIEYLLKHIRIGLERLTKLKKNA